MTKSWLRSIGVYLESEEIQRKNWGTWHCKVIHAPVWMDMWPRHSDHGWPRHFEGEVNIWSSLLRFAIQSLQWKDQTQATLLLFNSLPSRPWVVVCFDLRESGASLTSSSRPWRCLSEGADARTSQCFWRWPFGPAGRDKNTSAHFCILLSLPVGTWESVDGCLDELACFFS